MRPVHRLVLLSALALLAYTPAGRAQSRPYLGYVYPAGGQQGATFEVKVGGQGLDDNAEVTVSGEGVTAKMVQCCNPLGNRELSLLSKQLSELKRKAPKKASKSSPPPPPPDPATTEMAAKIQKLLQEDQRRPACAAFRGVAFIQVTIAPNAPPGERELRFVSRAGGASNPMVFYVGQVPEHTRTAMRTASRQILGKEAQALRNRPVNEAEDRISLPCTVNGQIASREINTYRFTAKKGQKLIITTYARQLIPYIADAVPGWFQPVLALYDADGKEVAYDDDYRFKPDPIILHDVAKDGEYVLSVFDSIYRGRNDFIYRINIGSLPFISSVFPLGGRANEQVTVAIRGFNLPTDTYNMNLNGAQPGLYPFTLGNKQQQANQVAFMVDTLPECLEKEAGDNSIAQRVSSPIIINGRIDKSDDWDIYEFSGNAGQTIVAEVHARRLDSPLDSIMKLTDGKGKLIGFNDDCEDLSSGINTHHADSYILAKLPENGLYYVHIGDAGRHGGQEYGYRLRISPPRPDFALRIVPSSAGLRPNGSAPLGVYAIRKDGFDGDITLTLKDPPTGFSLGSSAPPKPAKKIKGAKPPTPAPPASILPAAQPMAKIQIRTSSSAPKDSMNLRIVGRAKVGDMELVREAVPAEDRMQAFLWRHLVPAQELKVLVVGGKSTSPTPTRVPPELTPEQIAKAEAIVKAAEAKGRKFTKSQVSGLARNIKTLYEKGLLTDKFYGDSIAELGFVR